MEYGTAKQGDPEGSHKEKHWPPLNAPGLVLWAKRKGMPGKAPAIARAIGKRGGLRPRRFLRQALESTESIIQNLLTRLANEIEERWARG
jgi:hypothetical protein